MSPPPVPPASSGTAEHDALPPGTRFGEFEILHVVGIGGFGIVYRARDHSLERDVALKEYMPASLAMRGAGPQITVRSQSFAETYAIGLRSFVNEARLLARFDHPSLVKVYRFWEDNQTAYMVMPFLQGVTLRDTRRVMPNAPEEAWIRRVLDPIMGALELLHREGVYHRDIAPDNILLLHEGPPVLLDFGAARRVISDRTQSLTAILKPSYAPIEQYAEMTQLRQGPWTDIYALGAVVHYLLLGQPPAPATARALQEDGDSIADRSVPGVSPRFLEATAWALAVRPNQRPQSIDELRGAFDGRVAIPTLGRQTITLPGSLASAHAPPPSPAPPQTYQPTLRVDSASQPTEYWHRPTEAAMPPPTTGHAPPQASAFTTAPPSPPPTSEPPAWAPPPATPTTTRPPPAPAFDPRSAAAAAMRSQIRPRVPAAPPVAAPAPSSRRVAPVVVGVAVVVGLAAAAWFALGGHRNERVAAAPPAVPAASVARVAASSPPVMPAVMPAASTSAAPLATTSTAPVENAAVPAVATTAASVPSVAAVPATPSPSAVANALGVPPPSVAEGAAPKATAPVRVASPSSVASSASAPPRRTASTRSDGALRPSTGYERVPDASAATGPATTTAETRPRAPSNPPPAAANEAPAGPSSASEACGSRVFIARAVCMERECEKPAFRNSAECIPVLQQKQRRENR